MAIVTTDIDDGALVIASYEGSVFNIRISDAPEVVHLRIHDRSVGPQTVIQLAQLLVELIEAAGYGDELRIPEGVGA
ncbi:hypothetical protein [Nakamurella aerolata]|uniref:Uncharacterized protein n=1 Tax=Nakamurella aerolata TaxID=1656892 RepID=A0A849ACM2_9ACTN|nr:hypothetical protein [Nakamurella aerolata]NNG36908.1 hypothetical protein [Nakamurella aerolata]